MESTKRAVASQLVHSSSTFANPPDWAQGHAPNAILIPLGELPSRLADVERVLNVSGGMNAWTSAGLPVSRGA